MPLVPDGQTSWFLRFTMSLTADRQHDARSCPCKRIPLCLSSFTAAEHGDLNSLRHRHSDALSSRRDAAGNTPLHLAAQHGHAAVTAYLLNSGCDVNDAGSGATPLHRASFSGATSTMRLLLEDPRCNLLAQDTSFGDLKTPLHKAAVGGRYLAVQLLLEVSQGRKILPAVLACADADGANALQVALEGQRHNNPQGVARWNEVAGSLPNWGKCVELLSAAQESLERDPGGSGFRVSASAATTIPTHLAATSTSLECVDCSDGSCLTNAWEKQFKAALAMSVDSNLLASRNVVSPLPSKPAGGSSSPVATVVVPVDTVLSQGELPAGRECDVCHRVAYAFFRVDEKRICSQCQTKRVARSKTIENR